MGFGNRETAQHLSGLRTTSSFVPEPRVAKAQPWAGVSERFQRYLPFDYFEAPGFCAGLKIFTIVNKGVPNKSCGPSLLR